MNVFRDDCPDLTSSSEDNNDSDDIPELVEDTDSEPELENFHKFKVSFDSRLGACNFLGNSIVSYTKNLLLHNDAKQFVKNRFQLQKTFGKIKYNKIINNCVK